MNGIWLIVALLLYALPTLVVLKRGRAISRNRGNAAVLLNVFLGWTVVFWIISLAVALSGPSRVVAKRHRDKAAEEAEYSQAFQEMLARTDPQTRPSVSKR